MDTQQCLKILQLECVTSTKDLKKAYEDLVEVWHPDRFQHDPSLKKIAEEKLRKINLAYQHCLNYFDPDQRECFKPSHSASGEQETTGSQNNKQPSKIHSLIDDTRNQPSSESSDFSIIPTPKRSSFKRNILRGLIGVLLLGSGLGIYYLLETDNFLLQTNKPPSETLRKMATKLKKKEAIESKIPPVEHDIQDQSRTTKPLKTQEYYEIFLTDGSSFMTKSCWKEGNMVKFKIYKGSMGIEKHKVKKIVKHRYPKIK